jgi:hypothetical protein
VPELAGLADEEPGRDRDADAAAEALELHGLARGADGVDGGEDRVLVLLGQVDAERAHEARHVLAERVGRAAPRGQRRVRLRELVEELLRVAVRELEHVVGVDERVRAVADLVEVLDDELERLLRPIEQRLRHDLLDELDHLRLVVARRRGVAHTEAAPLSLRRSKIGRCIISAC